MPVKINLQDEGFILARVCHIFWAGSEEAYCSKQVGYLQLKL